MFVLRSSQATVAEKDVRWILSLAVSKSVIVSSPWPL